MIHDEQSQRLDDTSEGGHIIVTECEMIHAISSFSRIVRGGDESKKKSSSCGNRHTNRGHFCGRPGIISVDDGLVYAVQKLRYS